MLGASNAVTPYCKYPKPKPKPNPNPNSKVKTYCQYLESSASSSLHPSALQGRMEVPE